MTRALGTPPLPAVFGALAILAAASASTVEPLNLADLTRRAERIFLGRCLEATPEYAAGEIVTRVTFVVGEPLKGTSRDDTLSVLLPGGQLDGVRTWISGMPTFRPGEEVVLFLTGRDRRGRVWPVGLSQGGFRVQRRPGHPARVQRDFGGLRFQKRGSARPAAPARGGSTLAELLDAVRELAGREPGTSAR